MVQRKVSNKLGLQADHVKIEKQIRNPKAASFQYQEANKSRGPATKIMKKSRSIKLSEVEGLRSKAFKKSVSNGSNPGTPPPVHVPPALVRVPPATPQKQQGSKNYMKATSSSEARRERLEVSAGNTKSAPDRKISRRKLSLDSLTKQSRILSSFKKVRVLTKAPSFKPLRASVKKCPLPVDMNIQRATCSSTIKDSKFPLYLMLSPGGTEAEGTSATKVCPYSYCSLNGHHHAPLPPLKKFLSAKRKLIKTLKNMKGKSQRVELSGKGSNEEIIFVASSDLLQEKEIDFFIEIHADNKMDDEEFGRITSTDEESIIVKESEESLSGGPLISEINFEGDINIFSMAIDEGESYVKAEVEDEEEKYLQSSAQAKVEDEEKKYLQSSAQAEPPQGVLFESDFEASMDEDGAYSQVTDMEWEEGKNEAKFMVKTDEKPNLDVLYLLEYKSNSIRSVLTDEASQDVFEDQSADNDYLSDETCLSANEEIITIEEMSQLEDELQEKNVSAFPSTEEDVDQTEFIEGEEKNTETDTPDDSFLIKMEDQASDEHQKTDNFENHSVAEEIQDEFKRFDHEEGESRLSEDDFDEADRIEVRVDTESVKVVEATRKSKAFTYSHARTNLEQELSGVEKWKINRKTQTEESEDSREFNPKDPNYLPVIPEADAEKVDLRHQEMEERKNAAEWMLDHALQQAVTNLAPARKRKVALLVEAFETVVSPVPKWQTRLRHTTTAFTHGRPIQACN